VAPDVEGVLVRRVPAGLGVREDEAHRDSPVAQLRPSLLGPHEWSVMPKERANFVGLGTPGLSDELGRLVPTEARSMDQLIPGRAEPVEFHCCAHRGAGATG
jgi:hypothetical protein